MANISINDADKDKMIEGLMLDLNDSENSRHYWKSKALQYKMDLHGAQKGIRRLKTRLYNVSNWSELEHQSNKISFHHGENAGIAQSKRELESWQEKCEMLRKENQEIIKQRDQKTEDMLNMHELESKYK